MSRRISRRRFVRHATCAAGGLVLTPWLPGCRQKPAPEPEPETRGLPETAPPPETPPLESTYVEGSVISFPSLEIAGPPYEVGQAIGKRFSELIRKGLDRRAGWFADLKHYASSTEGKNAMRKFEDAAGKITPAALTELRGWADGSGIPFEDLMVLNHKSEIDTLIRNRAGMKDGEFQPGCSTVVLSTPDGVIHLHNEDGHDAYADLMFVLTVKPDGGIPFVCLSYPGILPGNAPGANARGIVQTTNYIASEEVRLGVGRYFLDRMIYEAKSLDEALSWATHPERAYAFHHVLTSIPEKKSLSVEVTIDRKQVHEIDGLFHHTNHLVLDEMADRPQDEEYVSSSSRNRWEVLTAWADGVEDPAGLSRDALLAPLSSHERKPYSPCRHPEGDVRGFTLSTAVFESDKPVMRLSKGQPCLERWMDHDIPGGAGLV